MKKRPQAHPKTQIIVASLATYFNTAPISVVVATSDCSSKSIVALAGSPAPTPTVEVSGLEQRFQGLSRLWKEETAGMSSLSQITSNKHYLRAIALGPEVIPCILNDLRAEAAPWFSALRALSGREDIGSEYRGQFRKIADAWIKWGVQKGYIYADRRTEEGSEVS